MSDRQVRRVTRFASQNVWALRESTLDAIVEVLRMRAAGIELSREEIQARIGAASPSQNGQRGTIAILPLCGVIAPKMNTMTMISGGTSLDQFMKAFRQYRDDASISAIVLDVDSPGGSVYGVQEAADEVFKAREIKPVIASVNPSCGSAALWIALQASEVLCTPSGDVGSLGVFCCHEDWSKANEMIGVKPTYIAYGTYKVEGNPDSALSDDTVAFYQAQVDATGETFVKAVARGRGVTTAVVKADYGQGRMLLAKDALAVGMIDRIGTLDDSIARASRAKVTRAAAHEDLPIYADASYGLDLASAADQTGILTIDAARRALEIDPLVEDVHEHQDRTVVDALAPPTEPDPETVDQAQADRDAIEVARA